MKHLAWADVASAAAPFRDVATCPVEPVRSHVYFAINGDGFIKVGRTGKDPKYRIREINCRPNLRALGAAVGVDLQPFCLGGCVRGYVAREHAIHLALQADAVGHELFRGPIASAFWAHLALEAFPALASEIARKKRSIFGVVA